MRICNTHAHLLDKMSLKDYIAKLSSEVVILGNENEVHVTIGNESCDLDSIVCAISYAHFLAQQHSVSVSLPVLQCRRNDFALRTDAVWLFDYLDLNPSHLLFSDEITDCLITVNKVAMTLVDHAHHTGPLSQLLNTTVISIIDHHTELSPRPEGNDVVIEPVGSCATLITERLLRMDEYVMPPTIATMLLGAILLDTVGLIEDSGRVTERDKAMAKKLAPMSLISSDHLYSSLSAARISNVGLTIDQQLHKDLKCVEACGYHIGFSSVTYQIIDDELLKKEGIEEATHTFCQTYKLSVLVVLSVCIATDTISKKIAIIQPQKSDIADGLANMIENDPELQCERMAGNWCIMFHQGNTKLSRKYILPAVVNFMSSLSTSEAAINTAEMIPEYTVEEEAHDTRSYRRVCISDIEHGVVDMEIIKPFNKIIQHGGYVGSERHAVIVISACYLPPRSLPHYHNIIDNLFLYIMSVVQRLVVDDYIIVYLHSGAPRHSMPSLSMFHKFYSMVDRRLRKQLKHLYIVHPTFWVRSMLQIARPFVSSKFYNKVHFVHSLQQLPVQLETHLIPAPVIMTDTSQQPRPAQRYATHTTS